MVGANIEILGNAAVFINGKETLVGISSHRFDCVNILGMDYLMLRKELKYNLLGMDQQKVTLNF